MSARVPSNDAEGAVADPGAAAQNDGAATTPGSVLYGVGAAAATHAIVIWLPDPGPANDARDDDDSDALLAADPEFGEVCDARRAAWIESNERQSQTDAAGRRPSADKEHDDERT